VARSGYPSPAASRGDSDQAPAGSCQSPDRRGGPVWVSEPRRLPGAIPTNILPRPKPRSSVEGKRNLRPAYSLAATVLCRAHRTVRRSMLLR
jgi:hypothetical protein